MGVWWWMDFFLIFLWFGNQPKNIIKSPSIHPHNHILPYFHCESILNNLQPIYNLSTTYLHPQNVPRGTLATPILG